MKQYGRALSAEPSNRVCRATELGWFDEIVRGSLYCEWTAGNIEGSGYRMKVITHILVFALLAAFGTVAVANVSAAGSMKMQMLTAADAHAGMVECDDCDADGPSTMSCGEMCFTSHTIALAETGSEILSMHRIAFLDVSDFSIGRQAPPDPFPPKAIILN